MTKCMQSYLSHLTVFLMQKFNAFLMFVAHSGSSSLIDHVFILTLHFL